MVSDGSFPAGLLLAIASYDEVFVRVHRSYIENAHICPLCCDVFASGQELLEALKNGCPYQLVLLDSATRDMDAMALCARIQALPAEQRPWLLVPTQSVDELTARMQGTGEAGCLRGVDGLRTLLPTLYALARSHTPTAQQVALRRLLESWGVSLHEVSGIYLLESAARALQFTSNFAIRKDILCCIGERHNVSTTAVDSGIRRIIEQVERDGCPAWRDFRQKYPPRRGKYTTGVIIRAIYAELSRPPQGCAPTEPSEGEPHSDEREPEPV